MNDLSKNELINFTNVAFKAAEMTLPTYSCGKSKQTYTQHQLMALICLMTRLKVDYRVFTAIIELMPKLQEMIGLKSVPLLHCKNSSNVLDPIFWIKYSILLWIYSILRIHGWRLMEQGIQLTRPACITHVKSKNNVKDGGRATPKT